MWKKISSVITVVVILICYNHCGMQQGSNKKSSLEFSHPEDLGTNSSPIADQTSSANDMDLFSKTVWSITKQRCSSCHGSIQQPLHGASDLSTAYNAVLDSHKVNFSNPASSRLVLKLRDENHNCWSNCLDNSNQILDQINLWVKGREETSLVTSEPEVSSNLTTSESGTLDDILNSNGNSGFINLDTQAAMLQAPMTRGQSGDISFVHVDSKGSIKQSNDSSAGMAFINFSSMRTATYKMWALVNASSGSDDSFFMKVNNSNFAEWHIPRTNGFEWKLVTNSTGMNPVNFFIPQGDSNRLEIRQREDGTKLAAVILTDDFSQTPESFELGTSVTLAYDLSNMLNMGPSSVRLEIDCREFDEYTYQFSKPRIITNQRVHIKGMKLLVNGNYNPQHATYNFVDKVISSTNPNVSESSLLAIKENGNSADRFSFSFEVLELE